MLITLARKPLTGSVAANVLQHGCGALNIDASRIGTTDTLSIGSNNRSQGSVNYGMANDKQAQGQHVEGRWPANVLLHGNEVLAGFPDVKGASSRTDTVSAGMFHGGDKGTVYPDSGSAARFFKQIG